MKYNYNLYNKLVFRRHNMCNALSRLSSFNRVGFRNRVNRLNRSSHLKPVTTIRRFNY